MISPAERNSSTGTWYGDYRNDHPMDNRGLSKMGHYVLVRATTVVRSLSLLFHEPQKSFSKCERKYFPCVHVCLRVERNFHAKSTKDSIFEKSFLKEVILPFEGTKEK